MKKRWLIVAAVVIVLALLPLFISSPYVIHILNLTFLYIVAATSFRTIVISGQFPLGHGAFMGIGAYASAMAAKWLGLSPWISIPFGTAVACAVGIVIGLPFARLRAVYYAMVSLFFNMGIVQVIHSLGRWSGGYSGLTGIPTLLGFSKTPYYFCFLFLCLLSILVLYRFEHSRIGITWKAIAQSYLIAWSVGINERFYRVFAVAIGCFFAGLVGALYAHYNGVIGTATFSFMATFMLLMFCVIGGMRSFLGPIIGTSVLVLVPEIFRSLKQFSPYLAAGIMIFVVFFLPQGLVSLPGLMLRKMGKRHAP